MSNKSTNPRKTKTTNTKAKTETQTTQKTPPTGALAAHDAHDAPVDQLTVPEFDYANYSEPWLKTLTEQPLISPHFVVVLHDQVVQASFDWLMAHAPPELVTLYRCADSMQIYCEEFHASGGFISADSNSSILEAVHKAINTLDKMGKGDFESMG